MQFFHIGSFYFKSTEEKDAWQADIIDLIAGDVGHDTNVYIQTD
jgi:hypothetical protein